MTFFTDLQSKIASAFAYLESLVTTFFSAGIKVIAANGGHVLLDAALSAVQAAEATGGSGPAKLAAAQTAVLATLKAEGIPVLQNAVNLAIEGAVAQLNASQKAAPPAAVTSYTSTASTSD